MDAEQWRQIKPILDSALELTPAARRDFLNTVCVDTALRREVDSLLLAHDQADPNVLRPGAWLSADSDEELRFRLPPGKRIGAYEILEEIAQGGMGAVYRAVRADGQYTQQVALKIIRAELGGQFTAARFRNERQILARLDHPNIARILDGGVTADGLPYFVMEFIDGLPITDYCCRYQLSIDARLKIFRTVCSAVHYAHQHLVIHRDIKPVNILITSDGVPKLLDFGIAKILDPSLLPEGTDVTAASGWLMTPEYASPEQFSGGDITTATDVYSLGLVLYELLAGRRAYSFTSHGTLEMARAVLETDPEKPSAAREPHRLSGDLDNITLKAIRKEPAARYTSVEQFSEDIRRHLEGLPVLARRSTLGYRCWKYVLRHRIGVAAAALILALLLAGIWSTRREAEIARGNELRAESRFNDVRQLANSLIFEMHDSIQNLPGATNARNLLLSRAVQYLDSLAKESSGDSGLQRELAAAYERVGDVECQPRAASLRDSDGALKSYRKSLGLREALAKNYHGDVQLMLGLAASSRKVAEVMVDTGDVNGALDHASRAIAIASSIRGGSASNEKARLTELLSDYLTRGVIEYNSIPRGGLQRPEPALQDYRRGLELASELLAVDPGNRSAVHQKAVIQERIGRILLRTGHPEEALKELSASLDIFHSLASDANDAGAQRNLAASLSMYGDGLSFEGRFRDALAYYRQELAIFQRLSEADPNDLNARISLGGSFYDVGACLMRQGKLMEALGLIQRARTIEEESIARDPKSTAVLSILGDYRMAEAETLVRMDQPARALESYRAAEAIYGKLVRLDEHNVDARVMAAAAEARTGATLLKIGELAQARQIFKEAIKASEPVVNSASPDHEALCTLAMAYAGLGNVASRFAVRSHDKAEQTAYWTEARSWYEKSLPVWEAIQNRHGFIDPNGFEIADPASVASALRQTTAKLQRISKPGDR
jgi:tetratricopeptide (TPR) repeat protein